MLSVLERKERVVEAEINILEYQEINRECLAPLHAAACRLRCAACAVPADPPSVHVLRFVKRLCGFSRVSPCQSRQCACMSQDFMLDYPEMLYCCAHRRRRGH